MKDINKFNVKSLIVDSLNTLRTFSLLILIFVAYYLLNWGIDTQVSNPGSLIYNLVLLLELCLLTFLFAGTYNTIKERSIHGFIPGFAWGPKLILLFLIDAVILFFILVGLIIAFTIPLVIVFIIIPRLEYSSVRIFMWVIVWFLALIPGWLGMAIGIPFMYLTGAMLVFKEVKIINAAQWGIRFIRNNPWSTIALGTVIILSALPTYFLAFFNSLHYISPIVVVLYSAFFLVFTITIVTEFYQKMIEVQNFDDRKFGRRFVLSIIPILLILAVFVAIKITPEISTVIK